MDVKSDVAWIVAVGVVVGEGSAVGVGNGLGVAVGRESALHASVVMITSKASRE